MSGGGALFSGDDRPAVLYVASALTLLSDSDRTLVGALSKLVDDAVARLGYEAPPWHIRVHMPAFTTSPSDQRKGAALSASQVYELNSRLLWGEADALVALNVGGGSYGAGQELTWAADHLLPTVVMTANGVPVSRQLRAFAEERDIEILEYPDEEDFSGILVQWLRRHESTVRDTARRRDTARTAATPRWDSLRRASGRAAEDEDLDERLAANRVPPRLLVRAVANIDVFLSLSQPELYAISAAVGVDLFSPPQRASRAARRLTGRELAALELAAEEQSWSVRRTLRAVDEANRLLAEPVPRRLLLDRPEIWQEIDRRLDRPQS